MTVAEASRQYQAQMEHMRAAFDTDTFDDDDRDQLLEDLGKAKAALEVAWLERMAAAA